MIDWSTPTLMAFGPIEGCGCPMEEWLYRGISASMHFEPTGECDVYFDGGEWEEDMSFNSRQGAFDWIDALPTEEELAARRGAAA